MHILFFTENFPPETNAAATRVYERALYWVKWGHKVTVITSTPNFPHGKVFQGYRNRWYQVDEMSGIRVVRVKTFISANEGVLKRTLDFLSFMASGFFAGLVQERPDVIAATSPQFFTAVAGWAVSRCRRAPFVFELGDLWPAFIVALGAMKPNIGLRFIEKLELYLYRQATAVASLTEAFRENLVARGIDESKIHVVINGVEVSTFHPTPCDQDLKRELGLENCFVAGYIGTHGVAQDLTRVLDSAELMRNQCDVRFLFVGAGAERNMLIAEAKRRDLHNVVFVGHQPKERMVKIWSICDAALVYLKNIPAFETVIPSKMFEAMAMGIPILFGAPRGEAVRILEKERAGIWVSLDDPNHLAQTILQVKQNTALREQLAQSALAAAPRYSRETQARSMLRVLENATVKGLISREQVVSVNQ